MTTAADASRDELVALQAPGDALPTSSQSWWVKLLSGFAVEFSRIRGRIDDMRRELQPTTADELLEEWEHCFALPDPCTAGLTLTREERLARLRAKVAALGGQSRSYFVLLARRMGLTITIEEPEPFYCGTHGCGDPVGGLEWQFCWIVHAPFVSSTVLRTLFECTFNALKPAGTTVGFQYFGTPSCIGPFSLGGGWTLGDGISLGSGWCPLPGDPPLYGPFLLDGSWTLGDGVTLGADWTT